MFTRENKQHYLLYICLLLFISTIFLIILDWKNSHRQFTFAMLDIGQGDALFIESPTGTQILIDGGPPKKILGSLRKVMSPFDRSLDAVFITNPDQDHIGGLQDVLKNYKVGYVLESGTTSDSKTFQNLKTDFYNKKIREVLVRKGMKIDLGGGAILTIIFPDQDVSLWPTNDGSIVARLDYGNTSILLTGDATMKTEKLILEKNKKENLESKILKVGHHGSRNSSSVSFVKTVSPKYAFISLGKDNKYGHPHQEVLDLFSQLGIKVFRTDKSGTIVLKSDGKEEKLSFFR